MFTLNQLAIIVLKTLVCLYVGMLQHKMSTKLRQVNRRSWDG